MITGMIRPACEAVFSLNSLVNIGIAIPWGPRVEPSGGEQQKMAIARALYKKSPVVILDEPTAALDPIAEYEIYRQFHTLVGGKTAFYISHRLSSCKFCDKIAVFSEGKIAEYGNHEALAAIPNGIYAKMFEAQAQYYR